MSWRIGLAALAAALLVAAWFAEGGEVLLLVAGVLAAALALLAPGRLSAYVAGTVAAVVVAFALGYARFEAANCDGGVECDVAPLEGMLWSAAARVVAAVGIVGREMRRQRAARASADATR